MKFTFLIPPTLKGKPADRNFGCNYGIVSFPPVHILYPATVLEKEGHEIEFIDCPIENKSAKWLKNYIKNNKSKDVDYYIFFTVFLAEETDIYWADYIKRNTNSKVIFIGPEPSHKPEYYKKHSDMVIVGEPEEEIKNPRDGIIYADLIENLDKLPFPDRDLLNNKEKYFSSKLSKKPITTMLTSRNCYGRCKYCIGMSYTFMREIGYKQIKSCKPPMSLRSPENIYKEFKMLKERGYKSVVIMDDNFVNGKERTKKICELIKPLNMEWGCLARADTLQDEELLKKMKEAGCQYIDIGVESFDQKVLDYVKKDTKVGEVFNAILLMKKTGIEPKINILLGCAPFQTKDDIKYTLKILKMLDIRIVSFGIVTPHPMTDYYKEVKKNNWFVDKDWKGVDPYKEAEIDLPGMGGEELQKMINYCYKDYYLRFGYILKRLKETKSLRELIDKIRMFWRLFT